MLKRIDISQIGAALYWGAVVESAKRNSDWIPANGGTETPYTTRNGFHVLYCWQPATGKHAYLNVNTDLIMSDEEAREAIGC